MTDLKCTRCGMTATYADACIEDIEQTCEEERETRDGRAYTIPVKHDWEEA